MTSQNTWDASIINELQGKKAPPNWSEQTGPFFHLQIPNEAPLGPFHGPVLKNFFETTNFPEGACVRDAKAIGEWQDIFGHPFFQRRKPQIISNEEMPQETNMAFVLIEGQKQGPFNHSDINSLIEERELLLTDQVSFDEGATWRKLYEYEEFDRRSHKQGALPESPGWEVFKESNTEIVAELNNPNDQKFEEEAIAGLAFLENIKSGKAAKSHERLVGNSEDQNQENEEVSADIESESTPHELPDNVSEFKAKAPLEESKSKSKAKYAYALGALFMLMGSFYFLTTDPKSNKRMTSRRSNSAQELKPVEAGSKAARSNKRNSYRSPRLKPKLNPRKRRPASITTSDSFRRDERRMDDSPYQDKDSYYAEQQQDDYYKDDYDYDRGDTPVEQDPIRSKLDKNTIDSTENYYDEQQQEQFQAEYDQPYEDAPQIEPSEVWGGEEENRQPASNEEELYDEDALYQDESF